MTQEVDWNRWNRGPKAPMIPPDILLIALLLVGTYLLWKFL